MESNPPSKAPTTKQQLELASLRLAHSQTRLIETLDYLDAVQLSASRSNRTLQDKYDRLKLKATAYLQCIDTLKSERDQLKDVVEEVIAKVERSSNKQLGSVAWKTSHIHVNGELATSLQPHIHFQLAQERHGKTVSTTTPADREAQAAALVRSLQAQLSGERELRADLEDKIVRLEAMIGRRDSELHSLVALNLLPPVQSRMPEPRPSENPPLQRSISHTDLSRLLEEQTHRNKALEDEILKLSEKLKETQARVQQPMESRSRSRGRRRSSPTSRQDTLSKSRSHLRPYASTMDKLKALEKDISTSRSVGRYPSSRSSSRGARRNISRGAAVRASLSVAHATMPQDPPQSIAWIMSQLGKLERGMEQLDRERRATFPGSMFDENDKTITPTSTPHISLPALLPSSSPPSPVLQGQVFSELKATIQDLGREIDRLRLGRKSFHMPRSSAPSSPLLSPSRPASAPSVSTDALQMKVANEALRPPFRRSKSSTAEFADPSSLSLPLPDDDTDFPPLPSHIMAPIEHPSFWGNDQDGGTSMKIRTLETQSSNVQGERDLLGQMIGTQGFQRERQQQPQPRTGDFRSGSSPNTSHPGARLPIASRGAIVHHVEQQSDLEVAETFPHGSISHLSLHPSSRHDDDGIAARCRQLETHIQHLRGVARGIGVEIPPPPSLDEDPAITETILARELRSIQDLLSSSSRHPQPEESNIQNAPSSQSDVPDSMVSRNANDTLQHFYNMDHREVFGSAVTFEAFSRHGPLTMDSTNNHQERYAFNRGGADSEIQAEETDSPRAESLLSSYQQTHNLYSHSGREEDEGGGPVTAESTEAQEPLDIWNSDGERSMELATTPPLPSLTAPSSSSGSVANLNLNLFPASSEYISDSSTPSSPLPGTPSTDALPQVGEEDDVEGDDVEEEQLANTHFGLIDDHDDNPQLDESTIPLPPSP